jgi:hypothetical protein
MKSFREVCAIVGCAGAPPITSFNVLRNNVEWIKLGPVSTSLRSILTEGSVTKFSLEAHKVKAVTTRAPGSDNLYCVMGIRIGGVDQPPVAAHIGPVETNDAAFQPFVHYIMLPVEDLSAPVIINYQLIGSSLADTDYVIQRLSEGAAALADKTDAFSVDLWSDLLAGNFAQASWLQDLFPGDYDGPLAIDQIVTSGEQMKSWTCSGFLAHWYDGPFRDYVGAPFAGRQSHYQVQMSIVRMFVGITN